MTAAAGEGGLGGSRHGSRRVGRVNWRRPAKAIAELLGLPFIAAKVEKNGERDFWASVNQGGLVTLDNADSRNHWLADALAAASTGGCSHQRQLYTNSATETLRASAWVCLTTANPTFGSDSGLADRLVVVRMERSDEVTCDAALSAEIIAARDAGLSHIAVTLQKALADTQPTPERLNARHPDFANFAVRIGRALGRESEVVAALRHAEEEKAVFCVENDEIAAALQVHMRGARFFKGTAVDLVERLVAVDPDLAARGPLSAKRVGKRLNSIWPHLSKVLTARKKLNAAGITVFEFELNNESLLSAPAPAPPEPEASFEAAEPAPATVTDREDL